MGIGRVMLKVVHGPSLYDQKGMAIDLIFSAEYRMVLDLPGKEFQCLSAPSIKSDWSSHTRFLANSIQGGYVLFFLEFLSMTFHRYGRD